MPTRLRRDAPRAPRLALAELRRIGDAMLGALHLEEAELSVLLASDAAIHVLNRRHRGKDRPTDVLAFPLAEAPQPRREHGAGKGKGPPRLLGDVVISLETAARQARGRRRPVLDEVRFLLAHGLLHLCGHDHATAKQKRAMDAETRRLVRAATQAPRERRVPTPRRAS